jgi:hypothetical protein
MTTEDTYTYPGIDELAASQAIDEIEANIAIAARELGHGDAVIVAGVRLVPEAWLEAAKKRIAELERVTQSR